MCRIHLTSGDELDIVLESDADYNLMMSSNQPPPNSYVALKFAGKWLTGKVLSSQPNVSSKFKDWVNIHLEGEKDPCSVFWMNEEEWEYDVEPEGLLLSAGFKESGQSIIEAKNIEFKSLVDL